MSALTEVTTPQGFRVQAPLASTADSVPTVFLTPGGFVASISAISPIAITPDANGNPVVSYNGGTINMNAGAALTGGSGGWQLTDYNSVNTPVFQTLQTNSTTRLAVAPIGTGVGAQIQFFSTSDLTRTNTGELAIGIGAAGVVFIQATKFGTGPPITSFSIGEVGNNGNNLAAINFVFGAAVTQFAVLRTAVQTIATLTANLPAAPGGGMRASVSDAVNPVVGVALTGGGHVFANVHYSPTTSQWIVDGI
jgi:hypothetical protein